MKAIACTRYGPPDVLQLRNIDLPSPKRNEVRIKIFATAVTASDCIVRGSKLPVWHPMGLMMGIVLGFGKPRNPILGCVLSGEIETVGKDVKKFEKGNQVFGFTVKSGIQIRFGTYAEYMCLPEDWFVTAKPINLTHEEAAAIPYGGLFAMHCLRKGDAQSGQNVLIYGASGAIGTSIVRLAKNLGAKVDAVCGTSNIEFVKSLGVDTAFDYTRDDSARDLKKYDLVFDAVGRRKSSRLKMLCKEALTPNGKYISVDDGAPKILSEDLVMLRELSEAGKIKPIIDKVFTLEQMSEAHRYTDKGHKRGNVVITVCQS